MLDSVPAIRLLNVPLMVAMLCLSDGLLDLHAEDGRVRYGAAREGEADVPAREAEGPAGGVTGERGRKG